MISKKKEVSRDPIHIHSKKFFFPPCMKFGNKVHFNSMCIFYYCKRSGCSKLTKNLKSLNRSEQNTDDQNDSVSRPLLLKPGCTLESLGSFVKIRMSEPHPQEVLTELIWSGAGPQYF